VTSESWVMRNIWDTKKGYKRGLVSAPIKLQSEGVKRLVEDALWTQGIRSKLDHDKKRHEFQTEHGFRKYFNTHCHASRVNPLYTEMLMGHSTGIVESYNKPTEEQMLDKYLKAVDALTINSEYILQIKDVSNVHLRSTIQRTKRRPKQKKIPSIWMKLPT
jgi:hypothetical protein